jgi:ribosomal protein S18 acetylase RimI-like enzyme
MAGWQMEIRELGDAEVEVFRAIRLEALRVDPDAFGQTLAAALESSDEDWRRSLSSALDSGTILVAEDAGSVRGVCACGPDANDPSAAFLWGMFVSPTGRGQGIGAALVRRAEAWAVSRGRLEMHALVAAPNRDAIGFYETMGYQIGPVVGRLRPGSEIPVHSIGRRLA